MNVHTVFLRDGCILPDQIDLHTEPFCKNWSVATGMLASELDAGIRRVGWHFMRMTDSQSSLGIGITPESATQRALINAFERLKGGFNSAELETLQITNCLGLQIAKVTLHARQIQKHTSLAHAEESRLQEVLTL